MQITVNQTVMNVKKLFSEQDIKLRIEQIAKEINTNFGSENTLIILVVLHGSLLFAADLVRNLSMPTEIESVRLKSYEGTKQSETIQLLTPLPKNLIGKNVLVVEDIIDSGRSIQFLIKELKDVGVNSIKICTLLNKPEAHIVQVPTDYICFSIANNFVIGYGLDLNGKYRNLPYVAELIKA